MLVYERELMLVINYEKYKGFLIEKLLEIIEKVLQLRETVKRVIWKSQAELNRKFEKMKIQVFQKEDLI